jgi:hypothetical protein
VTPKNIHYAYAVVGFKMASHCCSCASTDLKEDKVACDTTEQTLRMRRQLIMTSHCCCCASTNLKEEKVACDVSSGVYGEALSVDLTGQQRLQRQHKSTLLI